MHFYLYRTILFNINQKYKFYKYLVVIFQPLCPTAIINYGKSYFSLNFSYGSLFLFRQPYFVQILDANITATLIYCGLIIPSINYVVFFSKMYHYEKMQRNKLFKLLYLARYSINIFIIKYCIRMRHFVYNGYLSFFTSGISIIPTLHFIILITDYIQNWFD